MFYIHEIGGCPILRVFGEGWALTQPESSRRQQEPVIKCNGALVTMQSTRQDEHHASGGIAAYPCKNARMGHPRFVMGNEERSMERLGHPPNPLGWVERVFYLAELRVKASL